MHQVSSLLEKLNTHWVGLLFGSAIQPIVCSSDCGCAYPFVPPAVERHRPVWRHLDDFLMFQTDGHLPTRII
jgi:hypothetical protein